MTPLVFVQPIVSAVLFALGHLVRDGAPPLGSTHAARAVGAALCGLGLLFAHWGDWYFVLALWLAVWVGFYTDSKHGEANLGAQPYALISGLTSLAPAALVYAVFAVLGQENWLGLILFSVAATKGPLWKLCFLIFPQTGWFLPTRMAAMFFGALFGAAAGQK